MLRFYLNLLLTLGMLAVGAHSARGQREIGFIEKFALAEDRRQVLGELIPDTEEYFYYHCLHYQIQGQLPEAQAILDAWRAKLGDVASVRNMQARQRLLNYGENPRQTLDFLRDELGLQLKHAPPARDRAAALPNALDNRQLDIAKLLEASIAQDRSLSQIEVESLHLVLQRPLAADPLRSVLGRLERADWPGVVQRIAEELALKDSRGFGWAPVHALLTLTQLDDLQAALPQLREQDNFVRAYTARLAPPQGRLLSDRQVLRSYLERLLAWARRLPPSQNSFKALVLGNRLRLDMSEEKYDQALFLEYLALPRAASYYEPKRLANARAALAELSYTMDPQVPLPAMGDDTALVRRYLEQFLQSAESVDAFAPFLDREYVEQVFAETKILYGIGDEKTWYGKLTPAAQKALRERSELRFAPHNPSQYDASDAVSLAVELKNVERLIVKIYEINTLSYYRSNPGPIGTAIDLDGLVPNYQQQLDFSQPAQRRHATVLDLPQLTGRGTWVVDLLGAGQRSRALIQKGRLLALERLGDAGHALQIVDERGQPVADAHVELNGRTYTAGANGQIILPYAEQTVTRQLLLVDGDYASPLSIAHLSESYELQAGFLLDRQSLVAGTQAAVAIRGRLTCNGRPINIGLLADPQLTVQAVDSEGIASTQTVGGLELHDGDELVHSFLVPQRLAKLSFTLSGKVYNRNRDQRDSVQASTSMQCNGIQQTAQIPDFYLRQTPSGYRLLVLGRNGEPIARLPVAVAAKLRQFKNAQNFTLASNEAGAIDLGPLEHVEQLSVSAADMQPTSFTLANFHRAWPALVQIGRGEVLELPLGKESAEAAQFSLVELRRGAPQAFQANHLVIDRGALQVSPLEPGDYVLHDYESGQRVKIVVGDAESRQGFVAAAHRLLQTSRQVPLVIRQAEVVDGQLLVQVSGADEMTRVHIVAHDLLPDISNSRQLQLPYPPLMQRSIPAVQSHYVDSLQLDEEYSYILSRQGMKKFPGNMLPQPTLLVHPWEVSVTENQQQEAQLGDVMPNMAAPSAPPAESSAKRRSTATASRPDWKSYDFLAGGAAIVANLALVEGQVRIPLEPLAGYSSISVVVVHPTSSDSRQVVLQDSELRVRDQRLRESFDAQQHLSQVQKVELLAAGERKIFGDPRTRRLQAYTTVAEVFQLYSTLLDDPRWDKFRFVGRWHQLTDEERRARYNEMACHELNFFLYHKDPQFFAQVVQPLIAQKLDKQLVDRWLLGEPLEAYDELWQMQRLNTLERILLASRLPTADAGTRRWLEEWLQAHPLDPQTRQQRFEIALRGSALQTGMAGKADVALQAAVMGEHESLNAFGGMGGMAGGGRAMQAPRDLGRKPRSARELRQQRMREKEENRAEEADMDGAQSDFFAIDRPGGDTLGARLFQSLDQTREWAETQYYQVRLAEQQAALIAPNPFWQEFLTHEAKPFLPHALDLPCSSINEALCALAVMDLPLAATQQKLTVEGEQLVLASETAAVVYLESIEPSPETQSSESILVGQDLYLARPGTDEVNNRPWGEQTLLSNVPYRTNVVVTNPTAGLQRVQVLTQLPAGSLPLQGSKVTRSTAIELAPYSTAQVQTFFYFPEAGVFSHYGAQVSAQGQHLAATESKERRVTVEPESIDESTWSYVADWGSPAQVLQFLENANLQQLDLSRIAFRMSDAEFYRQVTALLSASGRFEPSLWAYAVAHNDPQGISQLLQQRPDFLSRLGPALESPLLRLDPRQQMSYEHLDYKPLVVARVHRLGRQNVILNPSLYRQYQALLNILAHQRTVINEQRMELCYYMLLQNRIVEALHWFDAAERERLESELQYDYFAAYLSFYRGQYAEALEIARKYATYPVPRWAELFAQVREQIAARESLLAGKENTVKAELEPSDERDQRMLTDRRQQQQTQLAGQAPSLDLQSGDGRLTIRHRNVQRLQVNYYLMDIELLFSRNPFVTRSGDAVPPIRPNLSQEIEMTAASGVHELELAKEMQNRNVLVEVTADGISRSQLLTASSLAVDVVEPFGWLQVRHQTGQAPLEAAYVKVFARHADGSTRFYKDGYTDLRGQFDYATLSTSELDSVQRFAILILHEDLGAIVQEASPPTR